MKLSDDFHDKKNHKLLGIVAAIICGLCIGYLAVNSADAACIFLAILIGTLAAWKVDCLNHLISLLIFLGIIILGGLPYIGLTTLFICAAAAFLDEIGNDNQQITSNRNLNTFFKYRFTLKIVVFIFAFLGLFPKIVTLGQILKIQYFSLETFIYFLLFEISYELVGSNFNTIYNRFHSLFRIFRSIYGATDD